MELEREDANWRPEGWSDWPFESKYEWLVANARFSSLTVSRYPHDTAAHADYLAKIDEAIDIDEIRRRFGPGRYDLRVNIQGGGSGARDPNFRIAQFPNQPTQVQHSATPTYPAYGRQDLNAVSNPSHLHGTALNQPGGQPSSTDLLLAEVLREMRGAKPQGGLSSMEEFERRLRDERERYERQRDEERQRYERERREAEEKARLQAEIDSLKREQDRMASEPRKQLENDPGLITTLIGKITDLSTQPQERAKVDETLRDPFSMIEKVYGVAEKLQPNAASTAATVLDGLGKMLSPAVSMLGEMMAAGRETQLEILKMRTASEIRAQEYELEKRRRIDEISFERAGLPAPQHAPQAEPSPSDLVDAHEIDPDAQEQVQMAKVARTFLTTLIKQAQHNANQPEGRRYSMAQIVDASITGTLVEHASEEVMDQLFDALDPWVFSKIQSEADELAFIKFLCSKLRWKDSVLVSSQKNNHEVRAGVLEYFRDVQVMLQGLKSGDEAVSDRWEAIFAHADMHPSTEA